MGLLPAFKVIQILLHVDKAIFTREHKDGAKAFQVTRFWFGDSQPALRFRTPKEKDKKMKLLRSLCTYQFIGKNLKIVLTPFD